MDHWYGFVMHTPRSVLAAIAALAVATMLLFGFSVAAPDAQGQTTSCPAGSVPSADGLSCVPTQTSGGADENVVTTTSCVQGVLSDDGTVCLVPRLDAAPAAASAGAAPLTAPIPTFTG